VVGNVASRLLGLRGLLLNVDRDGDVGYTALFDCGADGEVGDGFHVRTAHHAVVVNGDVDEKLVKLDVLLLEGTGDVVELHAGDSEYRLLIHLGVIETVE